jgi:glutamate/tyrosine decarboxylase-like PLP-dependent enzyme
MRKEETFDPEDWEAFSKLAHRMLSDTLEHLRGLTDLPAWQPMPPAVRDSFNEDLPAEGQGEEKAYQDFLARVRPFPNGNLHPRFFGWVQGNGTPLGMMADMLAAGLNPHLAGFDQAPALVEHEVLRWLASMMGLPASSSGLLVGGGSMANTLALAVARHQHAGFDLRGEGLWGRPRMVCYGSPQTHGWVRKACEFLGLGSDSFRAVELSSMKDAIRADRKSGLRPFCVIGTAGTVNTGAIDDLEALARLAEAEGLWFHVDGAFGAMAYLSKRLRPALAGLEKSHSLAFDLHKWAYLPFECACVLIRDARAHHQTFASSAPYLQTEERGVIAGGLPFADRGIELTRSFKALKIWLTLKAYGSRKLARMIEQNVEQARYLGRLVEAHECLELAAPVSLNIVCLRYRGDDTLNQELLRQIQESGVAVPSGTVINGRYAIRVCIVNHRTRFQDLDRFLQALLEIGGRLAQ